MLASSKHRPYFSHLTENMKKVYLSAVCPIDRFVSALLMVPSFGSCVNTLDVIAILCETKKEVELKWARFSWIVLMRWLLKGFYRACVCLCVCVCVCVCIKSIGSPGSALLPAQGGD